MNEDDPVQLVAITGGSGAGKSWLADRLQGLLGHKAGRLTQDSFYRDWSHVPPAQRAGLNYDHPDALDWTEFAAVLQNLRAGRACRLPDYDFSTHCRIPDGVFVRPRSMMIVDGLWLLNRPEIRQQFQLSIFLHCPEEERLRRRVARDTVERNRGEAAVQEQFQTTVMPMHRQFVDPQASHANLILHQPCRESEILQLQERLNRLVPMGTVIRDRLMALFRTAPLPLAEPAAYFS